MESAVARISKEGTRKISRENFGAFFCNIYLFLFSGACPFNRRSPLLNVRGNGNANLTVFEG